MKQSIVKTIFAALALSTSVLSAEEFVPIWPEGKMPVGTKKNLPVGAETVSEKGIVKNVTVPGFDLWFKGGCL